MHHSQNQWFEVETTGWRAACFVFCKNGFLWYKWKLSSRKTEDMVALLFCFYMLLFIFLFPFNFSVTEKGNIAWLAKDQTAFSNLNLELEVIHIACDFILPFILPPERKGNVIENVNWLDFWNWMGNFPPSPFAQSKCPSHSVQGSHELAIR